MLRKTIDINCDMGEGLGDDGKIMPFIDSCNIACGGHTGDKDSMRRTVELALKHHVNIGAHPSLPDPEHFGRRPFSFRHLAKGANGLVMEAEALKETLLEQIDQLSSVAREYGVQLSHIKPHGALYNQAAIDPFCAQLIADVVKASGASLSLMGLSGSLQAKISEDSGLLFLHEVFIDRNYLFSGQLAPRSQENALINDVSLMCDRALKMASQQAIETIDGGLLHLKADTYCLHGDHAQALEIALSVDQALKEAVVPVVATT